MTGMRTRHTTPTERSLPSWSDYVAAERKRERRLVCMIFAAIVLAVVLGVIYLERSAPTSRIGFDAGAGAAADHRAPLPRTAGEGGQ